MKNVFVIGSLNVDFSLTLKSFPKPGETILGKEFFMTFGGKGANQAVAAARMGAKTYMVGVVGNDHYGKDITENLKRNHIDTTFLSTTQEKTGIAFISVDKSGENSIVVVPGANHKLKKEYVEKAISRIKKNDIVVAQLEIPLEIVEESFKLAKEKGACTVLNPSPIQPLPQNLLKSVDVVIANETEAQNIVNTKKGQIEKAVGKLLKKGIQQIVITLGEKGVLYYRKQEKKQYDSLRVKSVDTTAAGDAFLGAFVAMLSLGKSEDTAIRYAIIAGAITTTKYGAQPSLPSFKEVLKYYKKNNINEK